MDSPIPAPPPHEQQQGWNRPTASPCPRIRTRETPSRHQHQRAGEKERERKGRGTGKGQGREGDIGVEGTEKICRDYSVLKQVPEDLFGRTRYTTSAIICFSGWKKKNFCLDLRQVLFDVHNASTYTPPNPISPLSQNL